MLSSCSVIFCHQSAIVVDVTALICTASDAVDRNINAVTAAKMSLAVHWKEEIRINCNMYAHVQVQVLLLVKLSMNMNLNTIVSVNKYGCWAVTLT